MEPIGRLAVVVSAKGTRANEGAVPVKLFNEGLIAVAFVLSTIEGLVG